MRHVYVCKFAMLNVCLSQGQGVVLGGSRSKGTTAAAATSTSEWVCDVGGVHLVVQEERGIFSLGWLFVRL